MKIKINFSDFWYPYSVEAKKKDNPIYKLLSKRFDLELSDDPDFIIYSSFGKNYLKYDCIRIFYTGENDRPDFKKCDHSFSFDYPVTEKNYRLPLYKLYNDVNTLTNEKDVGTIFKEKTKFCNFLYSNRKAQERIEFFHKLSKYKTVDSGGNVLNNLGYRVEDKLSFLRPYKFTIAFENASYPGYTTEKIMQAMVTHTIPIYWGNPLVYRDFNPKSFINCHDYNNFDEVIERVIEIDNNEDLYLQYLSEPYFHGNVENEFINENNILDRFEKIFMKNDIEGVARKIDKAKWLMFKARRGLSVRRWFK